MRGARAGEAHLERPEIKVVDDGWLGHLEGDGRLDEVPGTRRQVPTEVQRRRAVSRRREAARPWLSPEAHFGEPTSQT
jgi:hypothetical protein